MHRISGWGEVVGGGPTRNILAPLKCFDLPARGR